MALRIMLPAGHRNDVLYAHALIDGPRPDHVITEGSMTLTISGSPLRWPGPLR
ncbi:MAG: hypothetical protein ROR55_23755 [Devosia sp.]